MVPLPPVLQLEATLESGLASVLPLDTMAATEQISSSHADGSSSEALVCSGHINTSRGGLEPVANIGDL